MNALNNYLAEGQGEGKVPVSDFRRQAMQSIALEDILTADADSEEGVRNRAIYHLTRIHDTILQIASGLGAPVALS